MSYQPDFSGCWVKLQRARDHRNSLEAKIGPLFLGKPNQVRISGKLDSETGYHVFQVIAIPEFPLAYLGVLIGDVIHNLRCVLDHIVWQLALYKAGGKSPPGHRARKVGFPIVVEIPSTDIVPEEFASTGALKDVLPRHRAIIYEFQPYKRCHPAEDALAILHCLSNRDKHRVINPVLISTTDFHLPGGALDNVGVENFIFPSDKRLEIGAEVFRVPLTSLREPDMEMQGHSTPDIVLLQGDPIIKRLDDVASRVTQILSRIEPLF